MKIEKKKNHLSYTVCFNIGLMLVAINGMMSTTGLFAPNIHTLLLEFWSQSPNFTLLRTPELYGK